MAAGQSLEDVVSHMQSQMMAMAAKNAHLREQVQQMVAERSTNSNATPNTNASPAGAATPSSTGRPRKKLPDLRPFSGKRSEYNVWALDARQKLDVDGESIGSPRDQYAYLLHSIFPFRLEECSFSSSP